MGPLDDPMADDFFIPNPPLYGVKILTVIRKLENLTYRTISIITIIVYLLMTSITAMNHNSNFLPF